MRTFILALAVLILIVGTLFFTGRVLLSRTAKLSAAAENFPILTESITPSEKNAVLNSAEKFSETWTHTRKLVHFLVGSEEADLIDETLSDLRIRCLTNDPPGYMSARQKLLHSLTLLIPLI